MIELIITTALALYGTKVTWQEGMIFEKPKKWLDWAFFKRKVNPCATDETNERATRLGSYLSKPLYGCPACMASVWGTLIYFANYSFTWNIATITLWPPFVFATCAVTYILMWQFPFDD